MTLTESPTEGAVIQRDRRGMARVSFSGQSEFRGELWSRVTKNMRSLKGFTWNKHKSVKEGNIYQTQIKGIPTGGPYSIEIEIRIGKKVQEKHTLRNIWVGDLWLLAGQSNMRGAAKHPKRQKREEHIRCFYMHDEWDAARHPLHNVHAAIDPVHVGKSGGVDERTRGAGPGIAFAKEMFRRTRVPQGLIPCAQARTGMKDWNPRLKSPSGKSLYGAALRRVGNCGGKVAGILWYQGENDSATAQRARNYTSRTSKLIDELRKDIGPNNLPIVMAQLAHVKDQAKTLPFWPEIQTAQLQLSKRKRNLALVQTMDLKREDMIHLDYESQDILGRRMAEAMFGLLNLK